MFYGENMRIVRFQMKQETPSFGWMNEEKIGIIEGSIFGEFQRKEANIPINKVRLLEPVQPSKIICVGRNFVAHAQEHNAVVPEVPLLFLKPPSAIIGPNHEIIIPPQSQRVEHEAELVVVIGKQGRWISPNEANRYIFGYTIGNDVTARDLQNRDGQWTRGKSFDTFCPVGPWIETVFDPSDALITCRVNNELRQMASTRDIVFKINQLVAFASTVMTLMPGDLLFTGTPSGVGILNDGDSIEIQIEGIGSLINPVRAESSH